MYWRLHYNNVTAEAIGWTRPWSNLRESTVNEDSAYDTRVYTVCVSVFVIIQCLSVYLRVGIRVGRRSTWHIAAPCVSGSLFRTGANSFGLLLYCAPCAIRIFIDVFLFPHVVVNIGVLSRVFWYSCLKVFLGRLWNRKCNGSDVF